MTQTEFFKQHGHRLVRVHDDDTETGDFRLLFPEETEIAHTYQDLGYTIASVFEQENKEDFVVIDNDLGTAFHKIGMYVLL
ncbi:MAG: hypothetical protein EBR30_03715 [Cytophagia bacterium]|nr:hypothetical protein [Cytophagia bacterium]NBW34120.1 hypothetical protein [Cytophagia bacterium]